MKERELRRSMAVLPIGTVMKLTDLSARQIRYYEEQRLISPERNEGNRRMYSLSDIDVLFEISDLLSEGNNIAEVKQIFAKQKAKKARTLSINEVHAALENEFAQQGRFNNQTNALPFSQPRM
ncbi:MerR family transcriptional regulator [Lactococcus hircilactis]|uniref:MerR family transcriptional regulator n=1 Tax=Lactococcus hircilactis TaxID=1494462 RepID=A0A7X1Z8F7_9LACT|nr:MerR family transcriptional regulator [Lactococcus hircilactis]MQW39755.1 MerR family transcriptional regulator [Lactococcus hircilactis]